MNYKFYGKSIVRIPLLPLKISFDESELRKLYSRDDVMEALFLSSPDLHRECCKWLKNNDGKLEYAKLINSLLKYAKRMHSRCTPFGLFASCSVTEWGDKLIVAENTKTRRTKLDMNFTSALARNLSTRDYIQPFLKFYPNNTIYFLNDSWRYVEYSFKNNKRSYQMCSVDQSDYLALLLNRSTNGLTISQLSNLLISDDITEEEATNFILEIIDCQILVCNIEPMVTGPELLQHIISVFSSIENNSSLEFSAVFERLCRISKHLLRIDEKVGNNMECYNSLIEDIDQLNVPYAARKLIQTDLYRNLRSETGGTIDPKIVFQNSLATAIHFLNGVSSRNVKQDMNNFKSKFLDRYDYKEIPLLEALDTEIGIGYGSHSAEQGDISPLINGLTFPSKEKSSHDIKWDNGRAFLFQKLISAHQEKAGVIAITEEEVRSMEAELDNLPVTMSVVYSLVGKRDGRDLILLKNVGNASAVNLLGRFARGSDEILSIVRDISAFEKKYYEGKIVAEIAHLPEDDRLGNVISRPIIRDYEITYLSSSVLPRERQIFADDLLISIKYNRIYLRSKSLNKEIIPRMANAHNYSFNSLPIYKFLCDLQLQDLSSGIFFDWGSLSGEFRFLPRVEVANVIVSPASWQLRKIDFEELFPIGTSPLLENPFEEIYEAYVKPWKIRYGIPDVVLLIEGDNELLVNLKDRPSLLMFISILRKKNEVKMYEFLFDNDSALIKNESGEGYTNEFISIIMKDLPDSSKPRFPDFPLEPLTTTTRDFSIGSEWIYYKFYCGIKTADSVLVIIIYPLVEKLLRENIIDKWFFIRYKDPEHHLRVRFELTDISKIRELISYVKNAISEYEDTRLIWKTQIDTYSRELERYGHFTIGYSEKIFYFDSITVVKMLQNSAEESFRWKFAIKSVDELLKAFSLRLEDKTSLMLELKDEFGKEFNINKRLKLQLDTRYRENRSLISDILDNKSAESLELEGITTPKTEFISSIIGNFMNDLNKNTNNLSISSYLKSQIHMSLNRIFRSKQRMHEMVIYDFLWRTYRSKMAIQKKDL